MKIHHYTSIETLSVILEHKTICFNRLDQVDDREEAILDENMFVTYPSRFKNLFLYYT